jgi:hypothetical protein
MTRVSQCPISLRAEHPLYGRKHVIYTVGQLKASRTCQFQKLSMRTNAPLFGNQSYDWEFHLGAIARYDYD